MSGLQSELRIISRIFGETFKGIKRTRWMNLVIITTMAAILSIFGCLFRTSLAISNFVDKLGDSLEVSVYLKQGYKPEEISKQIMNTGLIQDIKIIYKEDAWKELKEQMEVPDIKNPLPDTLRVRVKNKEHVPAVINAVREMNSVEDIQYARQLAERIGHVGNLTNAGIVIVVLILGGLTLSIINNTIHLVIQSRKEEIEIMRMMGVSNGYIRSPYILQGAFYGFWGAMLALIPVFFLTAYISKIMNFFNLELLVFHTNLTVLTVILMGVIVGGLGSMVAVKKYLNL